MKQLSVVAGLLANKDYVQYEDDLTDTILNKDYDLSRITTSYVTKGTGPQCSVGDWATVHWVGTLAADGRIVTDSKAEHWGNPKTFTVGEGQVFKCWDIVAPHLHGGDKVNLHCPSYYAYGSAHVVSPLSADFIPLNSDVNFQVEVLSCAREPHPPKEITWPHTTTMQPNTCFYLHSKTGADENLDQVLTVVGNKLSIEHKVVFDEEQQWYWDEKTGQLSNGAHADLVVDWSEPLKGITLAAKGASQFQNGLDFTAEGKLVTPNAEPINTTYQFAGKPFTYKHEDGSIALAGDTGENGQFWHIEYCGAH